MMKTLMFMLFCALLAFTAYADFTPTDKPAFDVASIGDRDLTHFSLTGVVPIKPLEGYVGIEYIRTGVNDTDPALHITGRVEGGKSFKNIGFRGYVRYGQRTTMYQDSLWHGGVYIAAKVSNLLSIGVGTWTEREQLLEMYQIEIDESEDNVDFGPRAHMEIHYKGFHVLGEIMPDIQFNGYNIRARPSITIPVASILFLEQISLVLSGGIDYDSQVKHVVIEPFQWHYKHAFRFSF